jgi:hypothetical protein
MNATQEIEPLGKIEFCQWAILEIMGHQRFAGLVRECNIAGQGFLSIEIPETKKQKAFTKLFSPASVYAITPTTQELATAVAESVAQAPISVYELPEWMQAKLRAPAMQRLDGNAADDRDLLDDEMDEDL